MRRHIQDDRGQAIFMAPIGFIIVLLLGGVVLEVGNLHLRQRQLDDLADSAASNAAGAGFDVDHFRSTGEIAVNGDAARDMVNLTAGNSNLDPVTVVRVNPVSAPDPGIEVELHYTHEFIFGRQVFGASQTLDAVGNASLITSVGS